MGIRHPNSAELAIYHGYQPRDTDPVGADEIALVEFTIADNLLNRSNSRWHPTALPELVELCPGLNLSLDHDWDAVEKSQGLIITAWQIIDAVAPPKLIKAAGNEDYNRQILSKEGYRSIHCDVAFRITSPTLDSLRFCEVQYVSQGGFDFGDIWCPICNDSYYGDCPHHLPSDVGMRGEPMPYYERKDVCDLGEVSLVLIPNLPGARVVSNAL